MTALNATLENMILGVGKYQDYATYLPECKEMVNGFPGLCISDSICEDIRHRFAERADR